MSPNDDGSTPGNLILLPGLEPNPQEVDAWTVEPDPQLESGTEEETLAPPRPHEVEAAIEALLLTADGPVSENQLHGWLAHPGLGAIRKGLDNIRNRLEQSHGGYRLVHVAKGWQLRTDPRFSRWVAEMRGGRPFRLSRAALETISIVAYRQPVTRSEIESLRGVDSGGILRMLCERRLCNVLGRKDEPGRPLIYGTTSEFLGLFGLRDLSDLPTLRDLRELQRDDPRSLNYDLTSEDLELDVVPTDLAPLSTVEESPST